MGWSKNFFVPSKIRNDSGPRLLTFNCHETWVHRLEHLGYPIDIIDGLPGRYCDRWDQRVRPVPRNSTLVSLEGVLKTRPSYYCIITHNLTDLLDSKSLPGPRILVIHSTLDARISQHGLGMPPERLKVLLHQYLDLIGGHVAAVSSLKGKSWSCTQDIVPLAVDVDRYLPWSGEIAAGIRVSNQIQSRKGILLWDFYRAAFQDLPIRLVGFNPDMPGVTPSQNWDHMKSLLSSHRFFIHTAHPMLEDGYNNATLEAMAAGLPILGNRHPSSPVEHGVSGFLSDDPAELGNYARLLLKDRELAGRMGAAARAAVAAKFPVQEFVKAFRNSIEIARAKWEKRKLPDLYFSGEKSEEITEGFSLRRSEYFPQLSTDFFSCLSAGEIDPAVAVLDKMMKLLGLPRELEIGSLEDLMNLVIKVSHQLRGIGDNPSASLLLKGLAEFVSTFKPDGRWKPGPSGPGFQVGKSFNFNPPQKKAFLRQVFHL
jgi:hypothetical protein